MLTGRLLQSKSTYKPLISSLQMRLYSHSFIKPNMVSQRQSRLTQMSMRHKSAAATGTSGQASSGAPIDVFELGAQLERQADIIQAIKVAKKDIMQKQSTGRQLALNISDSQGIKLKDHLETKEINAQSQATLYEREQRYEMFVEKMSQLYKNEKRMKKAQKQALARMELAPVQSLTPIKACLQEYAKISTKGFNCEVLAESLKRLNQAIAATGQSAQAMNDLTITELDRSWRMDKVSEDIKFGLDPNPNVFFSPQNLAKVSRELGNLGYKNTSLLPLWFDKIDAMLATPDTQDHIEGAKVGFDQAMFGGLKNFTPRHYIYQGFSGSQEFKQHVSTLLEYEQDKRQAMVEEIYQSSDGSKELAQVKKSASLLIEASKNVKNMQQEMEAAVRNVRQQYQKLKNAHDEHEFLQDHKYIHLDLLELQELLIKAGYLQPDEQVVNQDVKIGSLGMEAASEVFYNMVMNFYPDTLSPQYDQFYQASMEDKAKSASTTDQYTDLNLQSLSSTLVGLEQQALSYRRDIVDQDYPTEFYEKLMLPEDQWIARHEGRMSQHEKVHAAKSVSTHVRMERTYLNAWQTFYDRTEGIPETMRKMLENDQQSMAGLYSAMRALNACKYEAKDIRDEIGAQFAKCNFSTICDPQALVDGAVGLAGCWYKPKHEKLMLQTLTKQLQAKQATSKARRQYAQKTIDSLSFQQSIELLRALSTPGVAKNERNLVKSIKDLLQRLDDMNFDMITTELNYTEFGILYDAYVNLQFSEVKELRDLWQKSFKCEELRRALALKSVQMSKYAEHGAAQYDPIKPRVIGGLTESLIKADLQDLHIMQQNEQEGLNKGMFPHSPDVLMGYHGQKVGIFVLNNDTVMRDTDVPCGLTAARMKLVEQAHVLNDKKGTSVLQSVALPVRSVVDADLTSHKLQLRKDFSIQSFLEKSGLNAKTSGSTSVNTNILSDFSEKLTKLAVENYAGTSATFEEFLLQLLNLMQKRAKLDSVFEQEQVLGSIDELKLQMLQLLMMHEAQLSQHEKKIVSESLPDGYASFESLITEGLVKPITAAQLEITKQLGPQKEQRFWQGTRQGVEMPANTAGLTPKSVLPELLNHKFLLYDGYHQYSDWETKMRAAYDQLNLMELPSNHKDQARLNFVDQNDSMRRIPKGIFPDARKPRIVLRPPGSELACDAQALDSKLDEMTKFERSPIETMVNQELEKNMQIADKVLSEDIQIITNLQNIKHSMKSDLTDQQICDYLFDKLSFTDKLIDAHLSETQSKGDSRINFIERDAESYRNFMDEQMRTMTKQVAPYDHFYLKEAQKKGRPEDIAAKLIELSREHLVRPDYETELKKDELYKELEDILLNYEKANEDPFNLSKSMENKVEVTIDIAAFSPVQDRNNLGLSPVENEISPEIYLMQQRCRAEANLIKARIAYKIHSDIKLSANEKKYLDAWMDKSAEMKTLLPKSDIMVPQVPSNLTLQEALSPEDFYVLNSLSRVSISENLGHEIALNDLVLELSNFVDPDTVKKVELSILEDSLKQKWKLSSDFKLVEMRNKEIDIVMKQMEELSWRAASQFDKHERKNLEDLVFFDRGLDAFDNEFLDMDRESFVAFFDEANTYDSRVTLLENWLCRKDQEVRQRVTLPPPQMAKSDQQLHGMIDAPMKKARESLVGKMLTTDEFGEDRVAKSYDELTTRELHILAESLCVRLNLFQKKYPAFLPQVVKAVLEHRNLASSDHSILQTYCKLFELDWRGDSNIDNREQFLMTNPVYMHEKDRACLNSFGEISNEKVLQQIRQACQPYLPNLLTKMRQQQSAKK